MKTLTIASDGNCQYSSISYFEYGNMNEYMQVRENVYNELVHFKNEYAPFIDNSVNYSRYCNSVLEKGTWGDNITLRAASETYKIHVIVYVQTYFNQNISEMYTYEIIPKSPKKKATLLFIGNCHYNVLVEDDNKRRNEDVLEWQKNEKHITINPFSLNLKNQKNMVQDWLLFLDFLKLEKRSVDKVMKDDVYKTISKTNCIIGLFQSYLNKDILQELPNLTPIFHYCLSNPEPSSQEDILDCFGHLTKRIPSIPSCIVLKTMYDLNIIDKNAILRFNWKNLKYSRTLFTKIQPLIQWLSD
jgi:hypothetical protein